MLHPLTAGIIKQSPSIHRLTGSCFLHTKKFFFKFFFSIIFFLLSLSLFSQYRIKHIGLEQGLSQSSVHCIFKDTDGLMWFGTQDGLNRFDGYSFKIFHHDKNDSTTISDDFVLEIIEDNTNNLWVCTRNGLNRFDKKTETFTRIFLEGMDKNYYHNIFRSFFKDNNGDLVFHSVGKTGIALIGDDGNFQIKSEPSQFWKHDIFCYDSNGNIFISDSLGIWFYEYKNNSYAKPKELFLPAITNLHVTAMTVSNKNQLWVGEKNKLHVINIENKKHQTLSLPLELIQRISESHDGNYWVGGENGICVLDSQLNSITLLKNSPEDEKDLTSYSFTQIYHDRNGLVWLGTSDNGLSVFNPQKIFTTFKMKKNDKNSLSDNSVWSIFQNGKRLFIGTNSGLNVFFLNSENFFNYKKFEDNILSKQILPYELLAFNTRAITIDKSENIWIGGSKGIMVLDLSGKILKTFTTENSGLSHNNIFHLLTTKDGSIWISTPFCLNRYNPKTNSFEIYKNDSSNNSLPVNYIISTMEDQGGILWISTSNGLSLFNPNTKVFKNHLSEYNSKKSLSYNIVSSVLEDKRGRIWVSTLGGGINFFDREKEIFTSYTTADGLLNNVIYGIVEDEKGTLWMSSNRGISSFNPDTKVFSNYNVNDGIVSNEFSQNSFFKNDNGEIFFGSPEGLLIFNPDELIEQNILPKLVLTGVSVNYRKIIPYEIARKKSIDLFYGDKTISFEFAEPDFINAEKISYSFLLEGFNKKWVEVNSGQRIATFTNLPYRKFKFKVRTKKNNNRWSEPALNITVNVIPPFWMRGWFITTGAFFFLLILIFTVKFFSQRKLRKKLREIELQRKIQMERERISRDLHDNVGSHLTYIVTSLDNISHKLEKGEKGISEEKISSLSDFSRETIQQLRETIWAINKESILLSELKDKVNDHFLKIHDLTEHINFSVEMESENNNELKPSTAIHLFRIVQEAVNNCVKHSGAKTISVKISTMGNYLTIIIADDGKGIVQTENGNNHCGLENMKIRMKEIGGVFALNSKDGVGTEVIISLCL